jgi:hypothetical protein
MFRWSTALLLAVTLGCASSKSASTESPPPSGEAPPPAAQQCTPTQFVAAGQCYDSADAACAALGCGKCRTAETAPAQVSCEAE